MRIPVRNKKLAFPESLQFIRYLGLNYPTPNVSVTFASELPGTIYMGTSVIPARGFCDHTAVHVAAIHRTVAKQLDTIAHEYRHAMQHNEGMFADAPAFLYQGQGKQFRYCAAMENDAEDFARRVVAEYLELVDLSAEDRDFVTISSDIL